MSIRVGGKQDADVNTAVKELAAESNIRERVRMEIHIADQRVGRSWRLRAFYVQPERKVRKRAAWHAGFNRTCGDAGTPGGCDDLSRLSCGVVLADGSGNTAFVNRALESDFILSGTVAHRPQHSHTRNKLAGLPHARGEVAANSVRLGKSKE